MAEPNVIAGTIFWVLRIALVLFGGRGKTLLRRLAPTLGRLNLTIEPQVPVTFAGEKPPYDMLSVQVSNQARQDAERTRCEIRWRRMGKAFPERGDTVGAWFTTQSVSMSSFVGPPDESRTLPSNGQPERMGVLVKYPGQAAAYIVEKHNYIATSRAGGGPRWAHQSFALQPGGYELRLRFTSLGNLTGEVVLNVWNDGASGSLRSDLHALPTIN